MDDLPSSANVPILVCAACGEVYVDTAVVRQLDILFRQMLDGPVDHVIGHYCASWSGTAPSSLNSGRIARTS